MPVGNSTNKHRLLRAAAFAYSICMCTGGTISSCNPDRKRIGCLICNIDQKQVEKWIEEEDIAARDRLLDHLIIVKLQVKDQISSKQHHQLNQNIKREKNGCKHRNMIT